MKTILQFLRQPLKFHAILGLLILLHVCPSKAFESDLPVSYQWRDTNNTDYGNEKIYITAKKERSDSYLMTDYWRMLLAKGALRGSFGGPLPGGSNGTSSAGLQRPPTPDNSDTKDSARNPETCEPVLLATGEKVEEEIDFLSSGLYPVSHVRTYRSQKAAGSMFGPGWDSTYDFPKLGLMGSVCTNEICIWIKISAVINGARQVYEHIGWSGGNAVYMVGTSRAAGVFTYSPSSKTYTLTMMGRTYTYNSTGRIVSVQGAGGENLLLFYYQNQSQLIRVAAANSNFNAVQFTWSDYKVTTMTDPNGGKWKFTYDAAGRLKTVTSPAPNSSTRSYTYDAGGRLLGIVIDGRPFKTITYHADGRVKESGYSNGEERTTFQYDGNTTTTSDKYGQTVKYTFTIGPNGGKLLSSAARSESATCAPSVTKVAYDQYGYIDYTLDWRGIKTDYNYDASGRLLQLIEAAETTEQRTIVNEWDEDKLSRTSLWGMDGLEYYRERYSYYSPADGFASGKIKSLTRIDPANGAERTTYYEYTFNTIGFQIGSSISTQLPDGAIARTSETYYLGRITSTTNALGHTVSHLSVNGFGLPTQTVDANGVTTDFTYDGRGRLTSTVTHYAGGDQSTIWSFDREWIATIQRSNGQQITYQRNDAGRIVRVGNGLNEFIELGHDDISRVEWESSQRLVPLVTNGAPGGSPAGSFAQYSYLDTLGRVTSETSGQNISIARTFDAAGNVLSFTDGKGLTTNYLYDAFNRIAQINYPDGGVYYLRYFPTGNMRFVQFPDGQRTEYTYNAFGEITSVISPESGLISYSYDSAGRIRSLQDAAGRSVSFGWDTLGRLSWRTSGDRTETFSYDQGPYSIGRLTGVANSDAAISYQYSPDGQLSKRTSTASGLEQSIQWQYDGSGRIATLIYPTGVRLNYEYDQIGRLASVKGYWNSSIRTLVDNVIYQPAGSTIFGWRDYSRYARTFTLDFDRQISKISSTTGFGISYTRNPSGRIVSKIDAIHPEYSLSFDYDFGKRLTSASGPGANERFAWDSMGNRTSESSWGVFGQYWYDSSSRRLVTVGGSAPRNFNYDEVGRLMSDQRASGLLGFAYDAFNRVASVYLGNHQIANYTYTADGQRISKNWNGAVRRFEYDAAGFLLQESASSGGVSNYVWLDGQLIGTIRNGAYYVSNNDAVGRPESLIDQFGQTVWQAKNLAFGREITADTVGGLAIGYPGQYYDDETGYWNNWHRYYDSSVGRYTQPDPVGLAGGQNAYLYAAANPLSQTDFQGLDTPVCLYPGAMGAGHLGVGPGSNTTVGYYPSNALGAITGTRGVVKADDAHEPIACKIFPTSKEQEAKMNDFINRARGNSIYRLSGNNCAAFVHSVLAAGGISTIESKLPKVYFRDLPGRP